MNSAATARPAGVPPFVVDAHVDSLRRMVDRGDDYGIPIGDAQADIAKYRAGGCNVPWVAAWIDVRKYRGETAVERTNTLIAAYYQQARRHPRDLAACDTVAEVEQAVASGRVAMLLGIEGGIAINSDLSQIERYRRLGVTRMTVTWRGNLPWAGSSQGEDPKKGLTDFGRDVIREMNRVGMVVDLSHVSDATFYDALTVSTKPVIVSHSNARALANHPRNVTDDMLRALAKNGGVIGVNFYRTFLRDAGRWHVPPGPSLETVLDQVDHMVKIAGIDHVGIGSDFDGSIVPARGLETIADLPKLFEGLRARGYSEDDLAKFGGGNFLRVLRANEVPGGPTANAQELIAGTR